MNKLKDYELKWAPKGSRIDSKCRVQLFESIRSTAELPETIIIITELPDNPGRSVTNGIEEIINLLLSDHSLEPNQVKIIEHYVYKNEESFDYVSFGMVTKWSRGQWPVIAQMIGAPGKRWDEL